MVHSIELFLEAIFMLEDKILKLREVASVKFNFSLKPCNSGNNEDKKMVAVDNALKESLKKLEKDELFGVVLKESKEDSALKYKSFRKVISSRLSPEEEGMLYKIRLSELLDDIKKGKDIVVAINEFRNFYEIFPDMVREYINNNELLRAFIITMLLFEAADEVEALKVVPALAEHVRNNICEEQGHLIKSVFFEAFSKKDTTYSKFFTFAILSYIYRRGSYFDFISVYGNLLYYLTFIINDEDMEIFDAISKKLFDNIVRQSLINNLAKQLEAGFIFKKGNIKEFEKYTCSSIKNACVMSNLVDTCIYFKEYKTAKNILDYIFANRRLNKKVKLTLYYQYEKIYTELKDDKNSALVLKELYALGEAKIFPMIFDTYEKMKYLDKYKWELHEVSCKLVSVYDYCIALADRKYYDLLLDRFNKIRGTRETDYAIAFMDDRGIVLYENKMNIQLLEILAKKTRRYKELYRKVNSLLELIS